MPLFQAKDGQAVRMFPTRRSLQNEVETWKAEAKAWKARLDVAIELREKSEAGLRADNEELTSLLGALNSTNLQVRNQIEEQAAEIARLNGVIDMGQKTNEVITADLERYRAQALDAEVAYANAPSIAERDKLRARAVELMAVINELTAGHHEAAGKRGLSRCPKCNSNWPCSVEKIVANLDRS